METAIENMRDENGGAVAAAPRLSNDDPAEQETLQESENEEAEESEEIPGMAEACRRFPMPTSEQTEHALRELTWGEHFVVGRMVPSKGGSDLYLYNLKSAAIFLLDDDKAGIGKSTDQIIKLIDVDGFASWVRETLGDGPLAAAIEEDCPPEEPYNDRLKALQMLVALRMVQYGGLE